MFIKLIIYNIKFIFNEIKEELFLIMIKIHIIKLNHYKYQKFIIIYMI